MTILRKGHIKKKVTTIIITIIITIEEKNIAIIIATR